MVGLAVMLWASPVRAAATLQLDSQELVVGQQVTLRVSVDASQQPLQPEITVPEGLSLQVGGPPSFSSAFSFDGRNASRASTWTWTYGLTALEPGEYTVGPAVVGSQSSGTLPVRVTEGGDQELERMSAGLDLTRAYVGQTVIWRASVDTQLRGQPEPWRLPPLPGLELDPLVEELSENLVSAMNGQRIAGYRLALALRAAEAGVFETAASTFSLIVAVRNRGRVERSRQVFTAPGQSIEILPQPPGQSSNWSGLVGDFQASLSPERREIALGETLSMTLRVEGDGSLAGWLPPSLELDGLKVFAELPKLGGELSSQGYRGAGERSFALVPEQAGVLEVPAIAMQILDPSTGRYREISTEPFQVRVLEGQALEPERQSFAAAEPAGTPEALALEPRDPSRRAQLFSFTQPGVLAGLILPLLAFVCSVVLRWPKAPKPSELPFSAALQGLQDADLAAAQSLLRQVQAHLGQPPEAIPSDPSLWEELQAARFGGGDPQALVQRVRRAVAALLEQG